MTPSHQRRAARRAAMPRPRTPVEIKEFVARRIAERAENEERIARIMREVMESVSIRRRERAIERRQRRAQKRLQVECPRVPDGAGAAS